MIRNLKLLGLALGALLAIGVLSASAASASQGTLTSTSGETTLDIAEAELGHGFGNRLRAFGKTVKCPGSSYTGHEVLTVKETEEGKEHTRLKNGTTTATITPTYNEPACVAEFAGVHKATVTPNGCDFVFHLGETVAGGTDEYKVTADVVCPTGKVIDVDVYFAANNENLSVCTETVKAQNGLAGAIAKTNTAKDDIEVFGTFTGIHVEQDAGVGCAAETTNNGEFDLEATITGTNKSGVAEGVTISDV